MEQNYKIAIIGQGYVGLPLAMSFSKFYETVAFDISVNRIDELNRQYDCNLEVEIKKNQLLTKDELLHYQKEFGEVSFIAKELKKSKKK